MRQIVHLLVKEGHRRIAVIKPGDDIRYSVERLEGVKEGMRDCGLELDPQLVSPHHDPREHFADLERWFGLPEEERPTAFICFDDNRAAQVLITAQHLGIRVPEKCRVFGFGDTLARQLYYPVGSVVQPFETMGEAAVEIVTGGNGSDGLRHLFPTEIRAR